MFLTHPPACRFRVDVRDAAHPVARGLGKSFEVEDEPYFIELSPAAAQILLTADYGAAGRWPVVEKLYGTDTSVQSDGKTRVLGYTCQVAGHGHQAHGHRHNPYSRMGRASGTGSEQPATFRVPWESGAFSTLSSNAIAWAMAQDLRSRWRAMSSDNGNYTWVGFDNDNSQVELTPDTPVHFRHLTALLDRRAGRPEEDLVDDIRAYPGGARGRCRHRHAQPAGRPQRHEPQARGRAARCGEGARSRRRDRLPGHHRRRRQGVLGGRRHQGAGGRTTSATAARSRTGWAIRGAPSRSPSAPSRSSA